ncbi:MAG: deoxyribonuclease-1, partial [Gammaproteobacteria bacterium]
FKVWNKIDPPSKQEKIRNDRIERLQGNRNPYIDKPSLAERQKLTMLK